MSPYDFPGLVSGMIAFQLVLWGLVVAVLAGLRALLVRGQPGRGHVARGLLAGSGVVVAGGIAVGALAELTDAQRLLDRLGSPALALVAVAGAALLATWLARRGRTAPTGEPDDAGPPPSP